MGVRRSTRARTAWIAVGVSFAAVVAVVTAALYLAPRVIPNLTTEVADTDLDQVVVDGAVSASVTVPAGWAYHRGWGDDGVLVLHTPDGEVVATVTVSSAADEGLVDDAGAGWGPVAHEVLASGLDVHHTEDDERGAFLATVGEGGAPLVRFEVSGPAGGLTPYRPALAVLLESVRVRS